MNINSQSEQKHPSPRLIKNSNSTVECSLGPRLNLARTTFAQTKLTTPFKVPVIGNTRATLPVELIVWFYFILRALNNGDFREKTTGCNRL